MIPQLSIGDTVAGRYELRGTLGTCPSRTAYRAYDREVEVEVAFWSIRPECFPSDAARAFFIAAAKRTQTIKHVHLLRVFEAGLFRHDESAGPESPSLLYLTQQLGTSAELEGRLSAGGASEASAILRYAECIAAALDAVHAKGLHHGWMTPADVVEVAGQVKVCGAGLFSSMDASSSLALWGAARRYLAPELIAGGASSAAADWYSLAVILLELATGTAMPSPQKGLATLAVMAPAQAQALRSALSKNAVERPTSGQEFLGMVHRGWEAEAASTMDEPVSEDEGVDPHTEQSVKPIFVGSANSPKVKPMRPAIIRPEDPETVRVDSFIAAPLNEAATVSMGQEFIRSYIEEQSAGKPVTAKKLPAAAVVEPNPPGGFDEGDTVMSVSDSAGGFVEGTRGQEGAFPEGGFDESVTEHKPKAPPMSFEANPTADRPAKAQDGFDGGDTYEKRASRQARGQFDDGDTIDRVATPQPAGGSEEGETAAVTDAPPVDFDIGETDPITNAPPVDFDLSEPATATDAMAAPAGGFDEGETAADLEGPAVGFEDGDTPTHDAMPAGGFDESATVVDRRPNVRLLALSMKPKEEPKKAEVKREVHRGLAAKPVLRPLSSLAENRETPPSLGVLAPPRPTPPPRSSGKKMWIIMSLALVAGAGSVSLALLLFGDQSNEAAVESADASVDQVAPEEPAEPAPRELLVLGPSCQDGTVHLVERNLCIDAFESPGRGRQPQSGITLEDARSACAKRRMRLCTAEEWEASCQDKGETKFPYGPKFKREICNLRGEAVELAGSRDLCRSSFGIYDMSGNVAEWVEEGQIRGGSARDRSRGPCSLVRRERKHQSAFSDVGFRCCADAIASPPPSD